MDLLAAFTGGSRRNSYNEDSRPSISISPDGSVSLSPRGSVGQPECLEMTSTLKGSRLSLCVPKSPSTSRRNSRQQSPRASICSQQQSPRPSICISASSSRRNSHQQSQRPSICSQNQSPRPSICISPVDGHDGNPVPPPSPAVPSPTTADCPHHSPRPSITVSQDGSVAITPRSSISNTSDSGRGETSPLLRGSFLSLNVASSESGSGRRRSSVLALRDALIEAEIGNTPYEGTVHYTFHFSNIDG